MRIHRQLLAISILSLSFFAGCGGGGGGTITQPGPPPSLALSTVVSGLSNPVDLQTAADGTGRFFIVQQSGTIRILSNGSLLSNNFLDISGRVDFGGELGLLGVAFHPDYATNRRFFVNYTSSSGGLHTVIAEYTASASDPNTVDPATERILLTVNQPFENHNGGQLAFGADGFLYIGLGDGGSGGDPNGNGQNLQVLLGKMLRIDVDHMDSGLQYAIPADNPFIGIGRPEIWAYGFRNPWRFSFERGTGKLLVGDVGQDSWEEVDIGTRGGNFGWNTMEGAHCYPPGGNCNMTGLILPISEYDHSQGNGTIIGGYVYKGTISGMAGKYVYGDFLSGRIWSLAEAPPGTWTQSLLVSSGRPIVAFGQDSAGEVYVVDYGGTILKLVPQ